jgi:uncharacterized membrane protein
MRGRRGYLDWLRGVAVLIMIEAHVLDSWTRVPDREGRGFFYAMILGGFGAPLFLFLAGVTVPLSASAKLRRTGTVPAASLAVIRRGLEIFGLAFLFRLQAWILGWGPKRSLLKIDILNIMGPSIAAAGAMWGAVRSTRARVVVFVVAVLVMGFLTPIVRNLPAVAALPDPIQGYIRPVAGLSNFVIFPWAAFVFGGAIVGVLLDAAQGNDERRANLGFLVGGGSLAALAYWCSFLPTWYERADFWTTSPAFFFLRVGVMTAAVGLAYVWERRPRTDQRWSPFQQLGRTSLFIYWIHVEMVYGLISRPWHKGLSLTQSWIGWALFSLFMLLCSIVKERIVVRLKPDTTDIKSPTRHDR